MELVVAYVSLFIASESFHYEGAVRLVDGPYTSEGILQLYLSGRWGTVCSTSVFPNIAADIICSQLGYAESFSSRTMRYQLRYLCMQLCHFF